MLFEFQAWMTDSIIEAQKRVSDDNNFTFHGPLMANEAGHIANLTNQLKTVLLELRTRCLHFTSSHGVNELRKCPHCGLVWAKVVGCTGATSCGKMVNSIDVRNKGTGVMATFAFVWDESAAVLAITRKGERHAMKQVNSLCFYSLLVGPSVRPLETFDLSLFLRLLGITAAQSHTTGQLWL